ncbi:50S ribosomal protein L6 [Candidatus Saganbacteria bacterium]|uniref:Large ribosomal subunit protein uL6 n=1 Tax=Candidatus Saganbacteria bacterium TaxID=2575572 RepID=A0A9D6UMG4_UNCSA|nr:50S ribosomal protein L6 [Candidatus Saganbacteria bacterium]
MGRIGKRALVIPKGVEVVVEGDKVRIKGPKGSIVQTCNPAVAVKVDEGKVLTLCEGADPASRSLHGLYNSLIKNMLDGVTRGFEKRLELVGVGYRAQVQGKKLQLQLGYSHPLEIDPPAGIGFEVEGATKIKVLGVDRQQVGEVAAKIRGLREVEPYKGKGVRYFGEVVRRKAGKAAKTAVGGGAA